MTPNNEFTDLQAMKAQCALMKEKLQQQEIVNESILRKAMTERIASIKKWYRGQFLANTLPIVIFTLLFGFVMHLHWGFILLMDAVALLSIYLDWRGYRILNPDHLLSLPMTEAAERVARHKWWRKRSYQILALPGIALMVWVVLIACNYTWNPPVFALTTALIVGTSIWGITDERRQWKQLDETLRDIRRLKE